MDTYIEQSKMQLLGTWATEIEIIVSVLLLQTTIYVYGPCGKINKWQIHTIHNCEIEADIHYNESLMISTTLKWLKGCESVLMMVKCVYAI